jgi:hypothetical protein
MYYPCRGHVVIVAPGRTRQGSLKSEGDRMQKEKARPRGRLDLAGQRQVDLPVRTEGAMKGERHDNCPDLIGYEDLAENEMVGLQVMYDSVHKEDGSINPNPNRIIIHLPGVHRKEYFGCTEACGEPEVERTWLCFKPEEFTAEQLAALKAFEQAMHPERSA